MGEDALCGGVQRASRRSQRDALHTIPHTQSCGTRDGRVRESLSQTQLVKSTIIRRPRGDKEGVVAACYTGALLATRIVRVFIHTSSLAASVTSRVSAPAISARSMIRRAVTDIYSDPFAACELPALNCADNANVFDASFCQLILVRYHHIRTIACEPTQDQAF